MRVLLFGVYDPTYSRNRILERAVRDAGHTVLHCRADARGWLKWGQLKTRLLWHRWHGTYDAVLVMFPAQTAVVVARMLSGKPVIADFFTSHYEGYVSDRAMANEGSLRAWWYRAQDRLLARCAHWYLVDTQEHANYYGEAFGLDVTRLTVVPVGSDARVIKHAPERKLEEGQDLMVHWHGSYIPLQGADVVVKAASLLAGSGVRFRMVGSGQTLGMAKALASELGVTTIEFMDHVPYAQLSSLMAQSDICLGIFGSSSKTQRVVPNKAYEAFAAGRTLVTADTPAMHELFDSSCAMLVPAGDERALAGSIVMLMRNTEMRLQLARAGHARYMEHAGPQALANIMKTVFTRLT